MACIVTAETATAQFAKNATAISGKIGEALKLTNPFIATLDAGTFENNVAAVQQAVTQGRMAAGDSKVRPTFSTSKICDNSLITVDGNGEIVFNYQIAYKQGTSNKICVNVAREVYKDSLMSTLNSYTDLIKEYTSNDVRVNMLDLSGYKYVVTANSNFAVGLTGGYGQGGTAGGVAFAALKSDAVLTSARLQRLARYLVEVGKVKRFGAGAGAHLIFIGGPGILETLRDGTLPDVRALAAGADAAGKEIIKGFTFESLYRGIKYAEDMQPLRANWNAGTSSYDLIEPEVNDVASVGTQALPAAAWLTATHEIGFLLGAESLRRDTPAEYSGEGIMKFERQLFGGKLEFIAQRDMSCNLFANWGVLAYQMARAYRPKYPWSIIPIVYRNPDACNLDGLTVCS